MKKYLFQAAFLSFLLVLTGCARVPVSPVTATYQPALSWPQRQAQLSAIQDWDLKSAMSVQQGKQVTFASLDWQQRGDHYQQQITGPFNLGGVRIVGMPGQVTLWKSENEKISAKTPEQLIQQAFQWQLPISNMYYWVRGLPAPGSSPQEVFDNFHRLTALTQDGWTIEYLAYQRINNIDLPQQMLLISAQLQVKLVIQQWRIYGRQMALK